MMVNSAGTCTGCANGFIYSGSTCVANTTSCGFGCAVAMSTGFTYDWPSCSTCRMSPSGTSLVKNA